jgi:hypothetical protein
MLTIVGRFNSAVKQFELVFKGLVCVCATKLHFKGIFSILTFFHVNQFKSTKLFLPKKDEISFIQIHTSSLMYTRPLVVSTCYGGGEEDELRLEQRLEHQQPRDTGLNCWGNCSGQSNFSRKLLFGPSPE